MTRPRGSAGLTLLEVLVASALLAIFFVSVYGLVEGTLKTRADIEEQATPYAVGPVVMQRIVQDLRSAVVEPYKDLDVFRAESKNVNGDSTTKIDFVASVRSRARVRVKDEMVAAAVNEVGFRARRSESANGLLALYRREDLGVDEEPLAGGSYHKLCDRVKTFKMEFFQEDPGDPATDDAKGVESWDAKAKKALPWGCRLTLVLVGEVDTDDRGHALRDAPEYAFVDFIVFPTRFDVAENKK